MWANRQSDVGQPDQAARTYRRALAYLQGQPVTEWTRGSIAVMYHQLGIAAQIGGRLDGADDWHRQAIQIREEIRSPARLATDYQGHGKGAQARGRLGAGGDWDR